MESRRRSGNVGQAWMTSTSAAADAGSTPAIESAGKKSGASSGASERGRSP
jgi:hypothetical protein